MDLACCRKTKLKHVKPFTLNTGYTTTAAERKLQDLASKLCELNGTFSNLHIQGLANWALSEKRMLFPVRPKMHSLEHLSLSLYFLIVI